MTEDQLVQLAKVAASLEEHVRELSDRYRELVMQRMVLLDACKQLVRAHESRDMVEFRNGLNSARDAIALAEGGF